MIRSTVLPLDTTHAQSLKDWQLEIDALSDYSDRVQAGKTKFKLLNTASNATFHHIRDVLSRMCQGARRCAYCEDSVADEVEHIHPKDLYPEFVFTWDNYLYACGPCNGPKNNKFSVICQNQSSLINVTRSRDALVVPPLAGVAALINPRTEDPLHFLFLDLLNTFTFLPRDGINHVDFLRADYTIKVLRLNDRDYLVNSRRTAFGNYRARLVEYIQQQQRGATQVELHRYRNELIQVGHKTVWREMQRQRSSYPELRSLFETAPEALTW